MEILSFIAADGKKIYAIGPFSEKAQASRAAAALPRICAAPDSRPRGAITRKAWAIFDLLSAKPRSELIAECERQGINKGTASTQYQKWRRAHAASSARS